MKKGPLFNAPLSALIARVGHTDAITLCDAGLPIPDGPERIDLAVTNGIPGFLDTLKTMAAELVIEKIVIANEMVQISPAFHKEFHDLIAAISSTQVAAIQVETVPHVEFKKMTKDSRAIVRTGECTYYANAIIICGVSF